MRRSVPVLLVALACAIAAATAYAAFGSTTTTGSNIVTAKRIFPGARSETAYVVSDQATGGAVNKNDPQGTAADGVTSTTGIWATTFAATRFLETTYSAPLPSGISISGLSYDLTWAGTNAADTVCFYFEVRRTSNAAVLATHGSTGTPVACMTGTTLTTTSTPLPEITTSADANDLTVRLFMKVTTARAVTVDRATVSGTGGNGFGAFTLQQTKYLDRAAAGANAALPYNLFAAEGVAATATTYNVWALAFSATRYLKFTFPAQHVPTGSTITSVTLTNIYRSSTSGKSTCVYYESYQGGTLVGANGSSGASFSCSDTVNGWKTDSVTLTNVDTPAEVNGLIVRIYGKDTGPVGTSVDQIKLTVNYYLD